jgi:hypothetical protein
MQGSSKRPSEEAIMPPPCSTCDGIFNRPHVSFLDMTLGHDGHSYQIRVENLPIDISELRASAEGGCDWCNVQLYLFEQKATYIQCPLEDCSLSVSMRWYLSILEARKRDTGIDPAGRIPPKLSRYALHTAGDQRLATTGVSSIFMAPSSGSKAFRICMEVV